MPDAPRQLLQLFQAPRAGDLVLAAAPGADFRGPWKSRNTGPDTAVSLRNIWRSRSRPVRLFRTLPSVQ